MEFKGFCTWKYHLCYAYFVIHSKRKRDTLIAINYHKITVCFTRLQLAFKWFFKPSCFDINEWLAFWRILHQCLLKIWVGLMNMGSLYERDSECGWKDEREVGKEREGEGENVRE